MYDLLTAVIMFTMVMVLVVFSIEPVNNQIRILRKERGDSEPLRRLAVPDNRFFRGVANSRTGSIVALVMAPLLVVLWGSYLTIYLLLYILPLWIKDELGDAITTVVSSKRK